MSPRHLSRFAAAALSAGLTAALIGCAAEPSAEPTVRSFLLEWQSGDYQAAASRTNGDQEEVAEALRRFSDQLDLAALRLSLAPLKQNGESATASFEAQADLGIGDPVWTFSGAMPLERIDGTWLIDWSPSVMHPRLEEGERLAVTYDVPQRGEIVDRAGEPLVSNTDVIALGARPGQMSDLAASIEEFAELLEESPEPFLDRVRSAPPEELQPLVLLRAEEADLSLVRQAEEIEGIETSEMQMPITPAAAPALIGEVAGTHDRAVADRISGPYQAKDTVGLSGLQAVYQQRLAGSATTRVVTLDPEGELSTVLEEWEEEGEESETVQTTLDLTLQEIAEDVLATEPLDAHLVAVEVDSGDVLAAASHPRSYGNDGALTAQYLPGNAFTLISTAAMLAAGTVTPEHAAACEPELTVDGRTFVNRSGQQLWGEPEFTESFAHSCTTAFAELADALPAADLAAAAADFGIGADWQLPVSAFSGEFGEPESAGELAAAAVGEDPRSVMVSPLSMALAAGAVADGTWRAPRLVLGGENESTAETRIDEDAAADLRDMMRAPVEQGGATQANVGELPVHGQVGVVQQRIDDEERVVQWFVGYQGGIAFAVAVELASEVAHQYAVGFVSDFLQRLPQEPGQSPEGQEETQEEPGEEPRPEDGPEDGGAPEAAGG